MKVEALHKQYHSLKKYRQEHIEAIKPISILIVFLITACLILNLLNLDDYSVIFLTIKTIIISTTIYTIYQSAKDILYLFNYPLTNND
jgi:small-conductance mechanosensitive channel